jgi:predicted MFS family arabinose efflux permease
LLGGLLVDAGSWRLIFAINLLPIAVTLWLVRQLGSETNDRTSAKLDITGALLAAVGFGATVYALIEQPHLGWSNPYLYTSLFMGVLALIAFVWQEQRTKDPMLPLSLFRVRNFAYGNIATVFIYGGLSLATFVLSIFMQQTGGYSATMAGLALIPVTVIMFFLSSRFGGLSGIYGPRLFMTVGPMVAALGFATMLFVTSEVSYWRLLPGILLFGLGLAITVAPLTSAILGSIKDTQSGIGSAVNNAVSRIAGLVAIAALGTIVGTSIGMTGFHRAIIVTAVMMFLGGLVSAIGIRNDISKS